MGYAWGCPLSLQGRALAPSCAQSTGWHCVSGPMLLWLAMAMLLVGSSSFFLCHWKACRRRIQQSRCLCLGVLGRVAALCWPALGACPACPYPDAHPPSPTLDIFAEFHLDYLTQTFQPKMEQGGEYIWSCRGPPGPGWTGVRLSWARELGRLTPRHCPPRGF